jgi:hypothetical protein
VAAAIDLSAIAAGVGGFVINGQCAYDYSGESVSSAGDVNGDGLADLIVGANGSDPAGGQRRRAQLRRLRQDGEHCRRPLGGRRRDRRLRDQRPVRW